MLYGRRVWNAVYFPTKYPLQVIMNLTLVGSQVTDGEEGTQSTK